MQTGRPTKYTKENLAKARYYIDNFQEFEDVIPSHIGLALHLGIRKSTVYDWASQENKKEFSDMLDEITKKQHQILISKGLTGDFNSNICKLVLSKHGYSDKQDTTISGPGGGPVEVKQTKFILVDSKEADGSKDS